MADLDQHPAAVTAAIGESKAKVPLLAHSVRSNLAYPSRRGAMVKIGERAVTKWRLA